jgi:hypothetical protein
MPAIKLGLVDTAEDEEDGDDDDDDEDAWCTVLDEVLNDVVCAGGNGRKLEYTGVLGKVFEDDR